MVLTTPGMTSSILTAELLYHWWPVFLIYHTRVQTHFDPVALALWVDLVLMLSIDTRLYCVPWTNEGKDMNTAELHDVQPERGKAIYLAKGEHLKIINTHGTQVVDSWAFNTEDLNEIMSMHHTKSCLKKMLPAEGEAFVTYKRRPIVTFVEDHSPGVHDTILPACDRYRHIWEGDTSGTRNSCGDNLIRAFEDIGLEPPAVTPQPFTLWMNIRVRLSPDQRQEGKIDYLPTVTKPGDYAVFRAEMNCIFVISACPCDRLPDTVTSAGNIVLDNLVDIHGPDGPKEVHYQVY